MSEYKAVFNKDNHIAHRNDYPRQKHGWFGFAPAGTRRRYVTTGTGTYRYDPETGKEIPKSQQYSYRSEFLTDTGKKRYRSEQAKNDAKAKKNRMEEEAVGDVNRWTRDDISSAKDIVEGVGSVTKSAGELVTPFFKDPPRGRYDLSNMSDQELQAILRREQMERQYNDYFSPRQENQGKKFVETAVKVIGTTASITGTALGIALAIKELRS